MLKKNSVFVEGSRGFKGQNSAVKLEKPDLPAQLLNSVHIGGVDGSFGED